MPVVFYDGEIYQGCMMFSIGFDKILIALGCVGAYAYYQYTPKKPTITFKKLTDTASTPTRIAPDHKDIDAGVYLYSDEKCIIMPGCEHIVKTGLACKTSHSKRHLKIRSNSVDYFINVKNEEQELHVVVCNATENPLRIEHGQQIGQLMPLGYDGTACMLEF